MRESRSFWEYRSFPYLKGETKRSELLSSFHKVEKGQILLKDRYLWKVIQADRELGLLEWQKLNVLFYLIDKESFLNIALYELPDIYVQLRGKELPERLVLLKEPYPQELKKHPFVYFQYLFWSYLFEAEVAKKLQESQKQEEKFHKLYHFLGQEALEEIQDVLERDRMVLPESSHKEILQCFLLNFLGWYLFRPSFLPVFFPSLSDPKKVWEYVIQEFSLDVASLLEKVRPKGCVETSVLLSFVEKKEREDPREELEFYIVQALLLIQPEREEESLWEVWLEELLSPLFQKEGLRKPLTFGKLWEFGTAKGWEEEKILLCDQVFQKVIPSKYKGLSLFDRLTFPFWIGKEKKLESFPLPEYLEEGLERESISSKEKALLFLLLFFQVFWIPLKILFLLFPGWMETTRLGRRWLRSYVLLEARLSFLKGLWWESRRLGKKEWGNFAQALFAYHQLFLLLSYLGCATQKVEEKIQNLGKKIGKTFCEVFSVKESIQPALLSLISCLVRECPLPYGYKKFLRKWQNTYVDYTQEYYQWSFWKRQTIPLEDLRKLKALSSLEKLIHRLSRLSLPFRQKQEALHSLEALHHQLQGQFLPEWRARVTRLFREKIPFCEDSPKEVLGFHKAVEDFLHLMIRKKHTHYSDLRDVVSGNTIAIPDLKSPWEWLRGDQLLQLDRALAKEFPAIHRAGEVYMGIIHRIGSFLFGWKIGRGFSKYLLLPFGGAFVLYEALNYILKLFGLAGVLLLPIQTSWKLAAYLSPKIQEFLEISAKKLAPKVQTLLVNGKEVKRTLSLYEQIDYVIHLYSLVICILVGGFLFLFFAYTSLGRKVGYHLLFSLYRLLKTLFWNIPRWVWKLPWLQAIYRHRIWLILHTLLLKPALYSTLVVLPLYHGTSWGREFGLASLYGVAVLFANLVMNTPLGRSLFNYFEDRVVEGVYFINNTLFVQIYHLVMETFRLLLQWVDQWLANIDDYFRFRVEQSRWTKVWKALLGKIWYGIGYLFRFTINLIVEPQVNPIKHFPIVTVSHKLILPFAILLTESSRQLLSEYFGPTSYLTWLGVGLVFLFTQFGIPGICGFMAWEFKEDWKLYPHALPEAVKPVYFGSHGESMLRMLRPGFHSGTLPKVYRQMRNAAKKDQDLMRWIEEKQHVQKDIERFFKVTLLMEWKRLSKENVQVELGTPLLYPYRLTVPVSVKWQEKQWNFHLEFDYIRPYLFGYVSCDSTIDALKREAPHIASYLESSIFLLWKLSGVQIHLPPLLVYLREEKKLKGDLELGGDEEHLWVYSLRENLEASLEVSIPLRSREEEKLSQFYLPLRKLLWREYEEAVKAFQEKKSLVIEPVFYPRYSLRASLKDV